MSCPKLPNKKIYIYLSILISCNFIFSQNFKDSLLSRLSVAKHDTVKVNLLIEVGDKYYPTHPDTAFVYYNRALSLSKKADNDKSRANSILRLGKYYDYKKQPKKSIELYLEALEIFKTIDNQIGVGDCYRYIGNSFANLNSLNTSTEYYLKSLHVYEKINDKEGVGLIYNILGDMHWYHKNYDLAYDYYLKSEAIFIEQGNKFNILGSYINLGNVLSDRGDIEEGKKYYLKSIKIAQEIEDYEGVAINYCNLGDVYLSMGDYENALKYFDKSIELTQKFDYKSLDQILYLNYADTYLKLRQYKKSILYAEKSINSSVIHSWEDKNFENYSIISKAYAKLGNYKKAYENQQVYLKHSDSIYNVKKFEKLASSNVLYELENQEERIESLIKNEEIRTLQLDNQKILNYILGVSSIVFGILIILLIKQRNSRKKTLSLLKIQKERAEESETLYSGIFNNSTIGLYQTTPTGEIVSANNAIVKMLKFDSLEDLLQRDLTKMGYVNESRRIKFKKLLQEKDEITDFESEWYTKNGEIISVMEGAKAIKNAKGEIIRFDGAVHDITDKKRIQVKLIESLRKAKESDRLKSAFLANMSHEIRTPMNAILGFSDMLKDQELEIEKRVRFVEVINKSGKRLMTIINDLIDISKIESDQLKVDLNDINIVETLSEIIEIQKESNELLAKNNVELKLKSQANQKCSIIKTDEDRFIQIFNNLINNSSKFTKDGSIEVGYELKKISGNSMMVFFVKDTGSGIPKDKFKEVFNRFSQVDGDHFNEGNGLGLSICKGLMSKLKGEIWLESELGVGTTFYFSLPY